MGTTNRQTLDTRQYATLTLFLVTMLVGSWVVPSGWASGMMVGLAIGLTIAAAVHLVHANRAVSAPVATERSEPVHHASLRVAPGSS